MKKYSAALLFIGIFVLWGSAVLPWFWEKSEEEKKREALIGVLSNAFKANEISASLLKFPELEATKKKEEETKMLNLMEESNRLVKAVDDDYMKKIHPQLPFYLRQKLIEGQKQYISAYGGRAALPQVKAVYLLQEWQKFWAANAELITNKLYP